MPKLNGHHPGSRLRRPMSHILVIDDNRAVATALDLLFHLEGWRTIAATSPAEGLALIARGGVDLVVQDMNFTADTTSGQEGVELFRRIRDVEPDMPVILLTAWTHLEQAVELVKAGAADYLAKPWDDRKLVATVRNLMELGDANRRARKFERAASSARGALLRDFDLRGLVFESPAMERCVRLACQVARADVPVLVTGPNGAGKERIAEIVHANSRVKDGPFVAVNCGALPGELIEAELFGAEAGAYTGAGKAREGRFEAADGGTLFLDEIGNLSASGQMKLLRVLETGRFERLGSNKTREVKVRVISATNADLHAMIRAGGFREDLFYRLNVIEVALPPLADRPEDIVPLARHFTPEGVRLAPAAEDALRAHAWPGNVRELRNAITRAGLLCRDGVIEADDLGLPAAPRTISVEREREAVREPSREELEQALQAAGGVIAEAAAAIGLSRQALYRRLEKFGIAPRREA
jgi:DNA-binding NtrC family response regulator